MPNDQLFGKLQEQKVGEPKAHIIIKIGSFSNDHYKSLQQNEKDVNLIP